MHRISKTLALILALLLFTGCNTQPSAESTKPSPEPLVPSPMTWEKIDSIPIANDSMTEDELRQICVDFFRMQQTFQWVLLEDISYDNRGTYVTLHAGKIYAGSPYAARSKSGNLYMTMDYYDSDTGILQKPEMSDEDFIWHIGNHCTYGSFWGWARVVNSATAQWNWEMGLEKFGYIPLGNYSTADIQQWVEGVQNTSTVTQAAGEQTMLEAYAMLKKADGMYTWHGGDGNSHVRMAAQDAVVVRNPDGTINPDSSYVVYLDQHSDFTEHTVSDGTVVSVQGGVDEIVTFRKMYSSGYIPFTFAEFTGASAVEKSEVTVSFQNRERITSEELLRANITSNYAISHFTLTLTDAAGNVTYQKTAYADRILVMQMSLGNAVRVNLLKQQLASSDQTITITCRIGTGELITVYTGKLSA